MTKGMEKPVAVFWPSDRNWIHIFFDLDVKAIGCSRVSQVSYVASEYGDSEINSTLCVNFNEAGYYFTDECFHGVIH